MSNAQRNKETSLWDWLKRGLKLLKPLKHDVQRIENLVGVGTPDVEGCIGHGQFWCELKVSYPKANDNHSVKITSQQIRKAWRRVRAGGRSWVLIRVCGESWRENRHYLICGSKAEELERTISRKRLAELSHCDPTASSTAILKTMAGL